MNQGTSLRLRLTLIILGPLLLIATGIGLWAWTDAQTRAADRFDRSLLSTALAISRDVALTGGDALSEGTRDLLRDTSGGPVFYHVYAPDGVFVTGYATPPVPPESVTGDGPSQTYFDATYLGRPIRALRFSDRMTIDRLTGPFTFTVWQDTALRDGFVRSLTRRTSIVIASLIAALAFLVWFGVRLGLRPLSDLEDAIARRSATDLSPIRRPIPPEVSGIVGTLNRLLNELSATLQAKDDFVSNAAHQLRNPIAGVLSLAESLQTAPDDADLRARSTDIVDSARALSRLANGLLALERATAATEETFSVFDATEILLDIVPKMRSMCTGRGIALTDRVEPGRIPIRADRLLLEESLLNLVSNSLIHGGPDLKKISVILRRENPDCIIEITDDGVGLHPDEFDLALSRFGQVRQGEGSGLGLSIAAAAANVFGGSLSLDPSPKGLTVRITLPVQE